MGSEPAAAPDTIRAGMPRTFTSALLAATVGLLAAVNVGASSGAATPASTGTRAHADAAPTKAQAVAFAHAVNLSAADLPGFTVSHTNGKHSTAKEKQAERQLKHCLGEPKAHKGLVELGSKSFERETASSDVSVSSEVTVLRTPALAARGLALIRRPRTRKCAAHFFNLLISGLESTGAKIGKVKLSTSTPPAPGTQGSFGWRLSATVTAAKSSAHIAFYVDILGFVDGRAAVTLLSSSVPQPLPPDEELKLFSLLVERAKTHPV